MLRRSGRGSYPEDVRQDLAGTSDFAHEQPADAATIAAPLDFLGLNYYTRHHVRLSTYPGSAGVEFVPSGGPRTAMGWDIDASGLSEVLHRITRDYGPIPIVITENGAAFDDELGPTGAIDDAERRDYIAAHVGACAEALAGGVPLTGYFVWSLLDNFEWSHGYAKRFGIVHVDFATQERRVKESGRWYADFLAAHRNGILRP